MYFDRQNVISMHPKDKYLPFWVEIVIYSLMVCLLTFALTYIPLGGLTVLVGRANQKQEVKDVVGFFLGQSKNQVTAEVMKSYPEGYLVESIKDGKWMLLQMRYAPFSEGDTIKATIKRNGKEIFKAKIDSKYNARIKVYEVYQAELLQAKQEPAEKEK